MSYLFLQQPSAYSQYFRVSAALSEVSMNLYSLIFFKAYGLLHLLLFSVVWALIKNVSFIIHFQTLFVRTYTYRVLLLLYDSVRRRDANTASRGPVVVVVGQNPKRFAYIILLFGFWMWVWNSCATSSNFFSIYRGAEEQAVWPVMGWVNEWSWFKVEPWIEGHKLWVRDNLPVTDSYTGAWAIRTSELWWIWRN